MSADCRYMLRLCIITAWQCYSVSTNSHSFSTAFILNRHHTIAHFICLVKFCTKKWNSCNESALLARLLYNMSQREAMASQAFKCKQISPFYQIKCCIVCVNMSNAIQSEFCIKKLSSLNFDFFPNIQICGSCAQNLLFLLKNVFFLSTLALWPIHTRIFISQRKREMGTMSNWPNSKVA